MPFPPCSNVAVGLSLLVHVAAAAVLVTEGGSSNRITSAGQAALGACLPSAPHDIALAQTRLHQRLRGKDAALQSAGANVDAAGSSQMLESISAEILTIESELDDAHLACKADQRITQQKIGQLENSNSQVAQDVGSIEAKIAASAGQLQPTTEKIQTLRDQVQKIRDHCEKDGKELSVSDAPKLIRVMKAQRLEAQCRNSARTMNDNLREAVGHLAKSQVALTQAVSMKTQFQQQMKEADAHMKRLVKLSQEKERDCQETSEQFQREMCGLVEMRQAIFWKFVDPAPEKVVTDCKVTDWTAGQCSKVCMASKDDEPGIQLLTRKKLMDRNNFGGQEFGASCPPLSRSVSCNEGALCPVDCKMSEWTGWAKCSRKCGGGEQYRTRSVQQFAKAGGAVCGITAESKLCNVGACQSSCTFAAWSPWGSCSKRCKWSNQVGHASRTRAVLTESKPGACKSSDARQTQKCNAQSCPRGVDNLDKLKCTSPQDILVVLDGRDEQGAQRGQRPEGRDGGRGGGRGGRAQPGSAFWNAQNLVKDIVEHSSFSGEGALLRYALVSFGDIRPKLVSPMVGNQRAFIDAMARSPPPLDRNGNVAEALSTAIQVFQLATAGERPLRPETLLLVTGDSLRSNVATATAARRLRAIGIRIVVVQVAEIKEPVVSGDESVCKIASAPCADNWLRVESWEKLSDKSQLGYYLSTVCPLKGAE